MRTNTRLEYADAPSIALWTGLAVGLGLIVHNVFFVFAAAIALSVPFGRFIDWVREGEQARFTTHRPA